MWKPFDPAALDLAGARTYREVPHPGRVHTGGLWHHLADGTVAYQTPDGHWMPAVHGPEALADPARFELVQGAPA